MYYYSPVEHYILLLETDWDLDQYQWSVMSRCTKCGEMLFPHDSRSAYAWAEDAYRKAINGGPSPETQRDARAPGIRKIWERRKPNYF